MSKRISLVFLLLPLVIMSSFAQTTYIPMGSDDYFLLDRLETLSGRFSDSLRLSLKEESRSRAIDFLDQKQNDKTLRLSAVDKYNMAQMISENGEWPYGGDGSVNSKISLWHTFYVKQHDLYHVKTKDFFFVINPVVNLMVTADNEQPKLSGSKSLLSLNQHGAELRARITSKIGFYSLLTDNQEYTPGFITRDVVGKDRVLPGYDYFLFSGNSGYSDYFNAVGYFDFAVVEDHINVTFGNGKNFIGDGIRSLFLSDNSANTTYLKVTTRYGKFNYQNLYMELTPVFTNLNIQIPHTFATMHHLDVNLAKWFNVGLFESTIFGTPDCYKIGYLNPVIFSRFIGSIGDDVNKELIGFDFKAIAAKRLRFYGQVVFDDLGILNSAAGAVSNKYGIQFGVRYMNAFSIKNLDLQGELNAVKPYTYAGTDTIISYTNYNQPLADPLGSGFVELIGIARYQPAKKVVLTFRGMYYKKGADSGKINYGDNIFTGEASAPPATTIPWINGVSTNCIMLSGNLSFRLFPNVFLDLGGAKRRFTANSAKALTTTTGTTTGDNSETWFYFGFRMNAPRRSYDAYY